MNDGDGKQPFDKAVRELYFSGNMRRRYCTFLELLKAAEVEEAGRVADAVRTEVEESMQETVRLLALNQYHLLADSGNWGQYGKDRIELSFCRVMLGIAPESAVTELDFENYRRMVLEDDSCGEISRAARLQKERETTFHLLGKPIALFKENLLNKELSFLSSRHKVHTGRSESYEDAIFGEAKRYRYEKYTIHLFLKEICRTPSNLMEAAALVAETSIVVRQQSCDWIFRLKWEDVFRAKWLERVRRCRSDAGAIGEAIKVRALQAYGAFTLADLSNVKTLFVEEMLEGILWHELASGFIMQDVLDMDASLLTMALRSQGENIVYIVRVALADWAPCEAKLQAPLQTMISVSATDPEKAARMLYVYLSDNWFLTSDTAFLGLQTDVLIATLIPFIEKTGINWELLRQKAQDIYQFLLSFEEKATGAIIEMLKRGTWHIRGYEYDFEFLEQHLLALITDEPVRNTDRRGRAILWRSLLSLSKDSAPQLYDDIAQYLREQEEIFSTQLLQLVDPAQAGRYGSNLRNYLLDEMKARGFSGYLPPPDAVAGESITLDQLRPPVGTSGWYDGRGSGE